MVYLDHNATTPLAEEVKRAMVAALELYGNPSSGHSIGRAAKEEIERSRDKVARLISADPAEIFFTSGGTESDNLAILGTAYRFGKGHIITSAIEHPAVANPVKWLELRGFESTHLPVDSDCRVSPDDVLKAMRKDTVLVTLMHSNNETGALQPIREIGEICRERGIAFHSDAAQSVGKVSVNVGDLLVDMLTLAPHKFYGPKGCGALYIRTGVEVMPVLFGAGHERGLRPGTENIVGIAGLGAACETAGRDMDIRYGCSVRLRDLLYDLMKESLDIRLNGHAELRLPNTLNVSIKGMLGEDLVSALSGKVAFSAGSACHSGVGTPSGVLKAMGLSDDDALSAVRFSVGKGNTIEEIEKAGALVREVVRSARQ